MRNILSFRRVIAQVGLGQDSCNRAMEPNVQIQAAPDPVLLVQNPFFMYSTFRRGSHVYVNRNRTIK